MPSKSRIDKQWKEISSYCSKRSDFQPFKYGKNIKIKIGDDEIKILSKRDLLKKQEYIMGKYGPNVNQVLYFTFDFDSIFEVVEKRVAELLQP